MLTFDATSNCFLGTDLTITSDAYLAAFNGVVADGVAIETALALVQEEDWWLAKLASAAATPQSETGVSDILAEAEAILRQLRPT